MSKLVKQIINTGAIPAHAPSWAKLDDAQWIQKLDSIIKHPDKYRNSILKQTLLKEANKLKPQTRITRYPFIYQDILKLVKLSCVSANQIPDYVIRFDDWYEEYPDGRSQYVGPTGRKMMCLDGDNNGDDLEDFLRRRSRL